MGFQTGSKIDPRLGALDYSGYAKAGEIEGQAMADLGSSIAGGIEYYTAKKAESKAFEQSVKGSLAMGEVMMKNLPNEQANIISEYMGKVGLGDPNVPMSQQYQASQDFNAGLSSMINTVKGDDVKFYQGQGSEVATMGGQAVGMRSLDSGVDFSRLFGGGQQGATPEEIAAAKAQLRGNQ
jgi:hypothetical protein